MNAQGMRTSTNRSRAIALAVAFGGLLSLTGGAAEAGMVTVTEFLIGGYGKFLTTSPEEARSLDDRLRARSGVEFKAFDEPLPETVPVCRFYQSTIGTHPSHFYTAFPDECEDLKGSPDWIYEGVAFHAFPASPEGACATGSTPVYRRYAVNRNGNVDPGNVPSPLHSFSPFSSWRSVGGGYWTREGLGPDGVAFCVPSFLDVATAQLAAVARSDWDITIRDPRSPSGELVVEVARAAPGGWGMPYQPFQDASEIAGYRGLASGGLTVHGLAAWAPYAGKVLFHFDVFSGSSPPSSAYWITYMLSVDNVGADAIGGCAHLRYDYGMGPTDAMSACLPFSGRRRP